MKFIFFILLSFSAFSSFAQKQVSINDIDKHIGDTVIVTSTVHSGRFLNSNALTLLNLGAAFPNQLLTVVIRGDNRNKFAEAPETFYNGKEITVTGRVESFNNKPQIVVTSKDQISIITKDEWRD